MQPNDELSDMARIFIILAMRGKALRQASGEVNNDGQAKSNLTPIRNEIEGNITDPPRQIPAEECKPYY